MGFFSCSTIHLFLVVQLLQTLFVSSQNIINGSIPVGESLTASESQQFYSSWRSPSGDFAFGFRKIQPNDDFSLAIWFDKIPDKTIVWHAQAVNTTTGLVPAGSIITLTADRGLVLTGPRGQQFWTSSLAPSSGSVSRGRINDAGNFGLLSEMTEDSGEFLWSSFANPTDTLLPTQVLALQNPSPLVFQQERDLHKKWTFLRQIEESFLRQKSRIQWLKEGDQNSPYFYRICQSRLSYNSIRSFLLPSGLLVTDPQQMSMIAINHFKQILGPVAIETPRIQSPPAWFQALTSFACTPVQMQMLTSIPTASEIMSVLLKLNPQQSPSIQQFFHSSFLPATANSTILSLVPKRPGASAIADFRPIACLNTIYKVISRLLVRKLKPLLPVLIVPNQTAFVRDRLLIENTILAGELVNGYHKRKGPKRITIKVDIAKAFDTVSWEFLFNCLQGLQIPNTYLGWLKACVCTPSYMIGYNGKVNGYFKGKRGLRQGDPLSPYLFVIAMNTLSLMLNRAAEEGKFKYHYKCEASKLTHLCFADDLLIFVEGSLSSVQNILQVLREFELRSGLAISVQKSSFFAAHGQ